MRTIPATEAKARFGEFLERAQRSPLGVLRRGQLVGVMVSAQDFDAMRSFYADRLLQTLHDTATAAERAGLTPETLAALLADES